MIRPIITNEAFSLRSFGGIINYYVHLLPALKRIGVEPSIAAPLRRGPALNDSRFLLKPSLRLPEGTRYTNRFANGLGWAQESLEAARHGNDQVLIHSSYFYRKIDGRLPSVVTVYDLIAELIPEERTRSSRVIQCKAEAVERADHILAISETTKRDLIDYYGLTPDRITTTPIASALPMASGQTQRELERESTTVLYVGKRDGYKNFRCLVEALADSQVPTELTIAAYGGGGFTAKEQELIASRGLTRRVHHVAPANGILDSLYRQALVFVCPSQYEGFGLPVVEAMERGCPVIVANAGALPEVAGDAALRFPPDQVDKLSEHLVSVYEASSLRSRLSQAGLAWSKNYSWERAARATKVGYIKALESAG